MLLGVDVGGTFTDAVLVVDGRLVTAKVPSTPADQSLGVLDAIRSALARADCDAARVVAFAHGTTVATNALLEGRGADTALVTTAGFEDVVELARQDRPHLYRLCEHRPAALVPPDRRFGAQERMGPGGVERPLAAESLAGLLGEIADAAPEAIAVVLLHADRHPAHEIAIGAALRDAFGDGVHIPLSHEVVGTFREYERAATTEVDAALSPLLRRYLLALGERTAPEGLPEPTVMQSSGGLTSLTQAAGHAALTVLSGPAAGAAGAAWVATRAGAPDALGFDMGGTSCDVCAILDGTVAEAAGGEIAGRPIALPTLDIHTVGAGGGSIAWRDPGGALRVGPRSAGADPGPACYGLGGREPTVTDANVVLGRLDPGTPLAGGIRLDAVAARDAVAALGDQIGLDPVATAIGIVRVANAEMVRALRVVSVERGIDPRGMALLPFGGAGGLHAAELADALGIDRIICPPAGGVLAALGLVVAERRRDVQRTLLSPLEDIDAAALQTIVEDLAADHDDTGEGAPVATVRVVHELRYRGQSFSLPVGGAPGAAPAELAEAFHVAHESRYGYRDDDTPVELVTVRVAVVSAGLDLPDEAGAASAPPQRTRRAVVFGAEPVAAMVIEGAPIAGQRVEGPAIVALDEATLLVPAGWAGTTGPTGVLDLRRTS